MAEKKLAPQKHAVLLLTIENDPTLAGLSEEDRTFIREWFTQVSFDDSDSREYFGTMFEDMVSENYRLEGAKPEYAFETVNEGLFRNFEKALGEFKQSKIIPMVAASAGGIMLSTALTGPLKDALKALAKQLNLIDVSQKAIARTGLTRGGGGQIDIRKIMQGINDRAGN